MHAFTSFALRTAAGCVAFGLAAGAAQAQTISGAGATFPYPIYAKWADAYQKETGIALNYQSIGSGGGIQQIMAKTVTFGASDMPLEPAKLDAAGLTQFPTVIGGAVPVVNIEGIGPDQLTLDGPTLARIFIGTITSWDDPAIKALNPGLALPAEAIAVVHRSDGSGTTFILTNYLSTVSPEWKDQVGANTAVEWPVGIGAKGNEGVAAQTMQTQGAIGYVEYAYATQNAMAFTRVVNHDGKAVTPSADAFQAAAANADWTHAQDFDVILTDEPGAGSWPIAGATFILVYKQPDDAQALSQALGFFDWAYANGDGMASDLDYVPLPDDLVASIEAVWHDRIKTADGQPVFAKP